MRRKSRKSENNGVTNTEDDQTIEKNANGTHNNDDVSDSSEPEPKKRKSGKKASVSPKKAPKEEKKVQESEEEADSKSEAEPEVESTEPKSKKSGRKASATPKKAEKKVEESGTDNDSEGDADYEVEAKKKKSGKKASATPKKAEKKVEESGKDDDSEGEADYEVESIVDQRTVKGIKQYLIKWKGYDSSANTWEVEESVNCPELLKKFLDSDKKSPKSKKLEKAVSKRGRPKTKKDEPAPDWDENEEFEIERIIEVHHKRKGGKEFLVSWKGYPASQSSWVDEEDMTCKDMVAKFMEKVKKAKISDQKDLRIDRKQTERFTLSTRDSGRRLSRRMVGKQRVHYHDAE